MAFSSCSSSRTFATKFSSIKVIFLLILVALFGSATVIKSVEAAAAEDTRLQTQTPLALPPAKPSFHRQQAYPFYPFACYRPGPCPPLGKGMSIEIGPFSWSYPLVPPKPNSIIPYSAGGGCFKCPPWVPKENVNPTNRKISTTEDNRM
ncbi:hypothetical protein RHMOL_Rhmol03G0294100 [Rhododendron molle]|uniref:Uncharacterized protein n=1 Tax=Rhododendron molle TaxID=49168 RepID=A0ACC0PL72_RHOML|nr:hypothetical protein RHMOL_Rhmol03G0294100 [Rhododendron molle]